MQLPSPDLEALCDSLQDSVVLLDDAGRIVHVNERFEAVVGRPADDLCGRSVATLREFTDDESFDEFRTAVDDVIAGRADERRVELPASAPTEGEVVVDARITGIATDGELTGAVVVIRDVTESKAHERALWQRSDQLAVINRVLRHDMRNDMTVVQGWAEQLGRIVETPEGRQAADRIVEHTTHLIELTKEARDLVDAVETDWEMELEPVDVDRILRREIETVREQYPEADVSLDGADRSVTVMANEFLGSVFGNLLTNAVIHNDGETPEITVTSERTDGRIEIRIADDGPGFPDGERLFAKGEKGLDSPGSGMGLYLVESLVSAYGGTVAVSDDEPRGTVVTVSLPVE